MLLFLNDCRDFPVERSLSGAISILLWAQRSQTSSASAMVWRVSPDTGDRKSNSQVRFSLARAAGEDLQQDQPHRLRVVETHSEHLCTIA